MSAVVYTGIRDVTWMYIHYVFSGILVSIKAVSYTEKVMLQVE